MANLDAELLAVYPEATQSALGRHRVLRYRDETPAHTYERVFRNIDDALLIELTASDSFDDSLACCLLDHVDRVQLPPQESDKIRVAPADLPSPSRFDCVVIAPPKVANRFEHQSERLQRLTYWVLPAFQGEFKDGDDAKAF